MNTTMHAARFDAGTGAVVIECLTLTDQEVVREATRWTTGRRGQVVEDPAELVRADLTVFATEAMVIGARMLAVTGQTADARALEQMLKDVGERTAAATIQAAELTGRAVKDATDTVARVADDARRAITEADRQSRTVFTAAVEAAKNELSAEVRRLFAGENPELLDRLGPLLDTFGTELDRRVRLSTEGLLEKAARQFDPADPTSPMAKHSAALTAQQEKAARQIGQHHAELAAKIDDLAAGLAVRAAKADVVRVTPIKGASFERRVHDLMVDIAAGLGDEYADTTTTVGLVPRSKKGDGVLRIEGGPPHVVVEMTDSARAGWGDYFDEAERNRAAVAALGIVRTADQNGGRTIRVLGSRRIVLSFDPEEDDPELLRTVVLLLRTVAITAAVRTGAAEIATAEERIAEALVHLDKIDAVKKLAGVIQKSASKIDSDCTVIGTVIHRLLDQALLALAGAETPATTVRRVGDVTSGAA